MAGRVLCPAAPSGRRRGGAEAAGRRGSPAAAVAPTAPQGPRCAASHSRRAPPPGRGARGQCAVAAAAEPGGGEPEPQGPSCFLASHYEVRIAMAGPLADRIEDAVDLLLSNGAKTVMVEENGCAFAVLKPKNPAVSDAKRAGGLGRPELVGTGDVSISRIASLAQTGVEDFDRGLVAAFEAADAEVGLGGAEAGVTDESSADPVIVANFAAGEDVAPCIAACEAALGETLDGAWSVEQSDEADWVSLVMNSFQPLEIIEGVWMVPTNQRPPDERAVNLRMEPGAAFGNGSHPTTRMCLGWLRDLSAGWGGGRPPPLLCDYGSGTGLLAIGALKFGAGFAVCTDVEPDSVAACEENAELNGVGSDLAAFLVEGTWESSGGQVVIPGIDEQDSFDVIVANILAPVLIEMKDIFMGNLKPGGNLGMSGIAEWQVPEVLEAYSDLQEVEVVYETGSDMEWAMVRGKKPLQ